ncbi:MAG: hypothetical protein CMP91_03050 [Gammaproteobacteria bacterium]|nr:hypothetical protein [Gammaproteobacteria bacterium]MAY02363.1 hypothetical protein [Gammaproteobacteria bacterium]
MSPAIKQKGFTLLEVLVVVFIIAIMTGLSFFALNQATDRRYTSQAEDFRVWLQQLSDMAMLEGAAYGVSYAQEGLQPVVYYDYAWYRVSTPGVFRFNDAASLSLVAEGSGDLQPVRQSANGQQRLPELIMSPDGYLEPDLDLALRFESFAPVFKFRQDNDGINLILERDL